MRSYQKNKETKCSRNLLNWKTQEHASDDSWLACENSRLTSGQVFRRLTVGKDGIDKRKRPVTQSAKSISYLRFHDLVQDKTRTIFSRTQ